MKHESATGGIRVEFTDDETGRLRTLGSELDRLTFHRAPGWVREMYLTHASMGRIMRTAVERSGQAPDPRQMGLPLGEGGPPHVS